MTGPPSASRIGVNIDNSIWAAMCMREHRRHIAADTRRVANSSTAHPHSHANVRPIGHASPRRCSRCTPARYTSAITIAAVPKNEVEPPVEQYPCHRRRAGEVVSDRDLGDRRIADPRWRRGAAQPDGDAERRAEDQPPRTARGGSAGHARVRVVAQCGQALTRRCRQPSTPRVHSASAFARTSRPYVVATRSTRSDPHQRVDRRR